MKSKNKRYFFFQKPHLNHLLFLFFFIISFLKTFTHTFFSEVQFLQEFFDLFLYNIGDYISIIPLVILKMRTKSKKEKVVSYSDSETQGNIDYIYTDLEWNKKCNGITIKKLLICIFTDFIAQIGFVVFDVIIYEKKIDEKFISFNSILIINVIAIFLLSRWILHTNYFKHNYFSLLINIICLIALLLIDLIEVINNANKILLQIINILIGILCKILYSTEDVIAKDLFLQHYFSTYTLLISKAFIQTFCLIIFCIPFFSIKLTDNNEEKKTIFSMMGRIIDDKKNIIISIIYMITTFFYNVSIFKIIDDFSPNHFVIARFTEYLGSIIINIIKYGVDSENYLALRIIIIIILLFASLIQNEFIVINACGLSKDTKLFLDYEAENELSKIKDFEEGENSNINYKERYTTEVELSTVY